MIYCVEDDANIRDLILYTLIASGFEAEGFEDGDQLFAALHERLPQMILLDVMLPGRDGIQILRTLRAQYATREIPIIIASARGTEFDKVLGLDSGADDYLAKPFGMMEMVSHVRAVLRRYEPRRTPEVMTVGNLVLNLSEHTVTVDGKPIFLTLKEYNLLTKLTENIGMVFTREHLLSSVWGVDYLGETRTVDVHVGSLRAKLGSAGDLIETVRGVGYKMRSGL